MVVGPDNSALQVFYGSLPVVGAILLASWREGKRFDDLKTSLNKRIDDLKDEMVRSFKQVNDQIGKVEDRLTEVEKAQRLVRP